MQRHDTATRGKIFAILETSRNDPPRGRVSACIQELQDRWNFTTSPLTIRRSIAKYEENGYIFDGKDRPHPGRKRIIGAVGEAEIAHELLSQPLRKVARSGTLFEDAEGGQVIVKRGTLRNVARRLDLVVAQPKRVRISHHYSHHKRARVSYSDFYLELSEFVRRRILYADEMSFPMGLSFNPKNSVFMVQRGLESKSNIHRVTKGSEGKFCSLFLVCNYWGIVCYFLFF